MTYKKFAEMMVDKEARKWLKEMCGEEWEIQYSDVKIEKTSDSKYIMYEVDCSISKINSIICKHYIVGGAIDEYSGIYNSVIWLPTERGKEIVWMASKTTREALGITEFVP